MSDDVGVEVLDVKVNPEQQLRQRSPKAEVLVDIEKSLYVRLGIPETNGAVIVSDIPHIFIADELRIRDKKYEGEPLLLNDVVIATGHGIRDRNDKWRFVGGQRVSDTVNSYNKYAKKEGMPEVEFIAVCNKDKLTEEAAIKVSEHDISKTISYAAGTEVNVEGIIESNGLSRIYVSSKGDMFNLDTLKTLKDIEIVK